MFFSSSPAFSSCKHWWYCMQKPCVREKGFWLVFEQWRSPFGTSATQLLHNSCLLNMSKNTGKKVFFSDATLELVSAVSFEQIYFGLLINKPLLIIIQAEIESEVLAQWSPRQKVSEVMGPINRLGFPRHGINLTNVQGKNKTQAILSKVTGPNNNTGKR